MSGRRLIPIDESPTTLLVSGREVLEVYFILGSWTALKVHRFSDPSNGWTSSPSVDNDREMTEGEREEIFDFYTASKLS